MISALRLISDFISNHPENSGAAVIAPNVGKYDAYNEKAIDAANQEVEFCLGRIYIYIYILTVPGAERLF